MSPEFRKCHGLNCSSTALIKAHIIPQGFARLLQKNGKNIDLSREKIAYAKSPMGLFDPNILCKACDGRLGQYDQYALEVCKGFGSSHVNHGSEFEWPDVDGEKIAKFVLSVLWRASISKRPELKDVDFGKKFEPIARDVLFGNRSLSTFFQFAVLPIRMVDAHFGAEGIEGFYTTPYKMKFGDLRAYSFALSGFKFVAKADSRSFDRILRPYLLRAVESIRGPFMELVDLNEFDSILQMKLAQVRRGHSLD